MFFPKDSDQKSGLKPVIPGEGHNCNEQLQHQGKKYKAEFAGEGTFFGNRFPSLRTFVDKKVGI